MDLATEQGSSLFCATTIKQEPVESDLPETPKQEIEQIFIKEETPQWNMAADSINTCDPLSVEKEVPEAEKNAGSVCETVFIKEEMECSITQDFPEPNTSNVKEEKNENEEYEEEKSKCKVDGTRSDNGPESSLIPDGAEGSSSHGNGADTAAGTDKTTWYTAERKEFWPYTSETEQMEYSCGICKETFSSYEYLKTHSHLDIIELLYSCSVCHQQFPHNNNLKKHILLHTGELL